MFSQLYVFVFRNDYEISSNKVRAKRYKVYIRGNVYFDIMVFSSLSPTTSCLEFLFDLFNLGDKKLFIRFHEEIRLNSRRHCAFLQKSRLKMKIQNPRQGFLDERAMITTALMMTITTTTAANIYLFKINKRNTRKRCEICSKLTIKTLDTALVFLLLTFSISHTCF